MKTLKELENMRNQECVPFGTQYNYLLARLEDYFVSKSDGLSRINSELSQWNEEAQKIIIQELVEAIYNSGVIELNKEEITARLKWSFYNEQ